MTCPRGACTVVPLAAEIDLVNCEQVYDRLYAAFVSGAAVVIADFTATSFCDCASLRRLVTVQRRAAAQGAQLRLVIPPGNPVRRLAELIGVAGQLHIYPCMGEAVGPPGPGPAPAESSRTGPGGAWELGNPICHRPPGRDTRQAKSAGPRETENAAFRP